MRVADTTDLAIPPLPFETAKRLAAAMTTDPVADDANGDDTTFPSIGGYVIRGELGRGASGVVYRAGLPGWNDEFAIKLLHAPIGGQRASKRAWRELDFVEAKELPGTPRVFDYGVHEGRVFIVSEHIEGRTLDTYCAGRSLRERVADLIRVSRAVHVLNAQGVIHRDLKPSNILMKDDGTPYIIDLGIASLADEQYVDSLDGAAEPLGTVGYMAPEQARGERSAASIASDVYSLGATACVVLTGHAPHDLTGKSLLEAIRCVGHEQPRSAATIDPALPASLAAVVDHALAPEDERFSSVAAFADDLQRWMDGRPVESEPASWRRACTLAIKRHPSRWAWSAVLVAAFVGLGVFGVTSSLQAADARVEHLEEALARQKLDSWVAGQRALLAKVMTTFVAASKEPDVVDAFEHMRLVQAYIDAGVDRGSDGIDDPVRLTQDVLAVRTLEHIYAAGMPDAPDASESRRADLTTKIMRALAAFPDDEATLDRLDTTGGEDSSQ